MATLGFIIDDMGNSLMLGNRAIQLPGKITYSFLPHRRYSPSLAGLAHQLGKGVMVHVPMSNIHQRPMGAGGLTEAQNKTSLQSSLRQSLSAVPYARGVNNHMGSALTQVQESMQWFMEVLKEQELFFIDSRTTHKSVAGDIAERWAIPSFSRDVFLDHITTQAAMQQQLLRAQHIARRHGHAIVIAHPHSSTLAFLEQELPKLQQQGVQLKLVSELLHEAQQRDQRYPLLAFKQRLQQQLR